METMMRGLAGDTSDSRIGVENNNNHCDHCEMRYTVHRCDETPSNGCPPSKSSSSFDSHEDSVNASSLSFQGHDQTLSPLIGNDVIAAESASFPAEAAESEHRRMAAVGVAYHDRFTRRLVRKDGSSNVTSGNVRQRNRKYLVDIFTTLVDLRWRYIVLIFTAAFVVSWTGFAALWFAIAVAHGDHLHGNDTDEWRPCVANVYDFTTALLFSIETQHTIGYGYRYVESTCPGTVAVLMAQSCFGVFVQSLVTGLVFAKLARPKRRAHTIMFSRNAVVARRSGQYCLLFRVGDMRKSHFVGTSIRAILVEDKNVEGRETIPLCQTPLDLETDSCRGDNFVFLVWPATVVHRITPKSGALWRVNADTLIKEQMEIIVILEGIVESTGGTTQVRTSYLPSDIYWDHRLAPLLTYQRENGQYKIDYEKFHDVLSTDSMPRCSAEQYYRERSGRDPDPEEESTSACFATTSGLTASKRRTVLRRMRNSLRGSRALLSGCQSSRNSTSSAPETPKRGATGSEAVNGTGSTIANGTGSPIANGTGSPIANGTGNETPETETIKKNGVGSPSS